MADEAWKRSDHAWWEAQKFDQKPHEIMIPHIKKLLDDQAQRYRNFERLIAAYEYGPKQMSWDSRDDKNLEDATMTFNYAAAAIDTVASKVVKSAVTPMPLTTGGTYEDRENAEELGQAIEGEWSKNKVRELFEDVTVDGFTLGNGSFYVPHGQGEIRIEFLPNEDIVVDEAECRYRMPSGMFIRFLIDRDRLLEKYGEANDNFFGSVRDRRLAIRKAAMSTKTYTQRDRLHNQVEVWVGYHLRSGAKADDGKYAVCIEGATLEFLDWNRDRFPIATFTPFKRRRYWHGRSMLAELLSPQREHDKITDRVQMSVHRLGGTHLLVNRKANIDTKDLSNGQGTSVEYDDVAGVDPVKPLNPTPVNPEMFDYRNGLVNEMMQRFGISSMAMTGAVEEGLHGASGRALELAEEQTAERLIFQQNAKDRVLVDLAWLIIEEAEAITEDDEDYAVNVKDKDGGLRKVKWRDALLARDEYTLDVKPAGDLASTPSARFDQLMRMADANRITNDEFRASWFMPDLKSLNDIDLSDSQIIEKVLSYIVKTGNAVLPESFDNLQLAVALGRKFYNMCRVKGVPEDRLRLLRDYVARANDLNKRAQQTLTPPQQQTAPAVGPQPNTPPVAA